MILQRSVFFLAEIPGNLWGTTSSMILCVSLLPSPAVSFAVTILLVIVALWPFLLGWHCKENFYWTGLKFLRKSALKRKGFVFEQLLLDGSRGTDHLVTVISSSNELPFCVVPCFYWVHWVQKTCSNHLNLLVRGVFLRLLIVGCDKQ